MESKAKILGHPIHQMLVVFPLGLLATAVIFDLITLRSGAPHWSEAAFYMMGAGIIGGLAAAIFGLIDWLAIPSDTRAKVVGAWHGLGNVIVVLLFACGFMLRWNRPDAPDASALTFSIIGLLLALVTGWLGGELMDRMGVGIDEGANLNAPNSLTDHTPHSHGTSPGHA
jgi:uncharacterized membrane protein